MKKLLQIIFFSVLFFLTVGINISYGGPPPSVIYGPITNPANGHQYYLLSQSSWDDAEARAVTLGGHLVTINNQAENDFITTTFSGYTDIWIGFTDQAIEGTWVWISGETPSYTNWNSGEPNNFGNEDYGMIYPGGTWNDLDDENDLYGLVEVNPAPVVPTFSQWGLILFGLLLLGAGTLYIYRKRRVSFQL
jgi:hypothetical protein